MLSNLPFRTVRPALSLASNTLAILIFTLCIVPAFTSAVWAQGPAVTFMGAQSALPASGLSNPWAAAVDGAGNVFIADNGNHRIVKLAADGVQTTLAVPGLGRPTGIAADQSGNVCISDWDNDTVVKVTAAGSSSIVASNLNRPFGVAMDTAGNCYVADSLNNRVLKIASNGSSATVGGTFSKPMGVAVNTAGDIYVADMTANKVFKVPAAGGANLTAATITNPISVAVDEAGNLYIAQMNTNAITKVLAGGSPNIGLGTGLNWPQSVGLDGSGNIYISDTYNNQVVKLSTSNVQFGLTPIGEMSTQTLSFAFNASTALGDIAVVTRGAANLDFQVAPGGSCSKGTMYSAGNTCTVSVKFAPVAPWQRTGAVSLMDSSAKAIISVALAGTGNGPAISFNPGTITTVAGNGNSTFNGDGGPATTTGLSLPENIALDGEGNLYISDTGINRVRKVARDGTISTVAGTGVRGYSGDGSAAINAMLDQPAGLAVDGAGSLYIADANRIRKVTPDGIIMTIAGGGTDIGDGGAAINAMLDRPLGIAVDGAGNLYIADFGNLRIRKITPDGIITTVAGNGTLGFGGDGGQATDAQLYGPIDVAVDGDGNLYIADAFNSRVRKVTPDGRISTVAGTGISGYGGDGGAATNAQLGDVQGVAVDGPGNLYIVDSSNGRIRKVTPDGIITTIAGNGTQQFSGDGRSPTDAGFFIVVSAAVDRGGNIYLSDRYNNRIRKINVTDAVSLTFDSVGVGSVSAAQDVTVLNTGNAPLGIDQISIGANFTLQGPHTSCNTTGHTLAPGASCILGIEFAPQVVGHISGSVVLTDNALNVLGATQIIALHDFQQQTSVITWPTPVAIAYGSRLGSQQLKATANVTGVFTYSPPASTLLTPGVHTLSVLFTPSDTVNYTSATATVQLTVNKRSLMVRPASFTIKAGQPLPVLTGQLVSVVNGDGITSSYSTTATAASPSGVYPITATLADPNNRLQYYNVTLMSAALTIASDPTITFLGGATDFLTIDVGQSSSPLSIGVRFTAPSTVGSIAVLAQGAIDSDFQVDTGTNPTACVPAPYSANQTCTVNVIFKPKSPGLRRGAVVLYDTATPGSALITVPVRGVGRAASIGFGPGIVTTIVGNGNASDGGDGGPAISALLNVPQYVTFDGDGNLYVSDTNNWRVRKVSPDGIISTAVGTGTYGNSGDSGPANSAPLSSPEGLAVDGAGNLYVADMGNQRIRKITPGGVISTVAGNGTVGFSGDGGLAVNAQLNYPMGLALDSAGSLYFAEYNGSRIRRVSPDGIISTVAGNGTTFSYSGDGGPATSASLNYPAGVAIDSVGNLYIADYGNNVIRKVGLDGIITTVAGNGSDGFSGDGGLARAAQLDSPWDVLVDSADNLYIVDQGNHRIRKVTNGIITTVSGSGPTGYQNGGFSGDGGSATTARFNSPNSAAFDSRGNLYIADWLNQRIRKVNLSDAPSLSFGSVNVGSVSAPQDVTVLNLGNAPLNISQIIPATNFTLQGPNTSCNATGQTLASGAACILGIEFAPQDAGIISGSVVLTDNALNVSTSHHAINVAGEVYQAQQTVITWSSPAAIIYGTALSPTQLNATADVPGTFTYVPPASTVLGAGTQSLNATFTPADTNRYTIASTIVSLTVNKAPLTVIAANATRVVGVPNPTLTGTITGLVSGDSITANYVTTATTASAVGTYPIVPTLVGPDGKLVNYTVASINGTLTISNAPPSTVSVTPSAGIGSSGSSQLFKLTFADATGFASITQTQAILSGTQSYGAGCAVIYTASTRSIQLKDDSGLNWSSPATLGVAGVLQNSQCSIDAGASLAAGLGNNLTLNYAVTFKPAYVGLKNIYMYAINKYGLNSGWSMLGTWTLPGKPSAVSVTPATGTGTAHLFQVKYSDLTGFAALTSTQTIFSAVQTYGTSCAVLYTASTGSIQMKDDSGMNWGAAAKLGVAGVLQNNQCSIDLGTSSAAGSGNNLTLSYAVTFKPAYAGGKNVFMYAANKFGLNSGWSIHGSWSVPTNPPTAVFVTPSTGSGAKQLFSLNYSDPAGFAAITSTQTILSSVRSYGTGCAVFYTASAQTIQLKDDSGANLSVPAKLGVAGVLQNSQCSIDVGASSAQGTGTNLALNYAVTFKLAYAGAKNIYTYAVNKFGLNSGWQTLGTWTVPAGAPSILSVTPYTGTGATQLFQLSYLDPAGFAAISTTQTIISSSRSYGASCAVIYTGSTQSIQLKDDSGMNWTAAGKLGVAGILQNSQCSIDLGASSTVGTATSLKLNLAVTFKPAYGGTKNIYSYAANKFGVNSGWQTLGTWIP